MTFSGPPIWRPGDPGAALELLRRYEPVLNFTEGEMFFPMSIDEYLQRSTLNERLDESGTAVLAQQGELTPSWLAELGARRFDRPMFLNLVYESVSGRALQQWQAHRPVTKERRTASRGGLFERAGNLLARIPAALASKAPAGKVAGVQSQYADVLAERPRFTYYGRVVRERAFTVLSYHYFYAMSDWRSSFLGAGDHVGDWHSVVVYLANAGDGYLEPAWLACETSDGVQVRVWDTPGLTLSDTHPHLYAGAGSHTAYFAPEDTVARAEVEPLRTLWARARGLLPSRRGRRRSRADAQGERGPAVPFVDYARGDGVRIGPGQSCEWSAVSLDEAGQSWVDDYRGAWGPDEGGVFAAGRSSRGPKYDHRGGVRRSWADPVGWANLDRQALPAMVDVELSRRISVLEHDAELVSAEADRLRGVLPQLEVEIEALEASRGTEALLNRRRGELARIEEEIAVYDLRHADDLTSAAACRDMQARRLAGSDPATPPLTPTRGSEAPPNGVSFAGIVVCLILAATILSVGGAPWYAGLVLLAGAVFAADSLLRGTFGSFVGSLAIGLAAATAVVLVYELFWPLAILMIALGGIALLAGDLRDLRVRL